MKKSLLIASVAAGFLAFSNAVGLAEVAKLPASGTTHFTTYFSVHPAHVVETVEDSTITVAELVGITRNPDHRGAVDRAFRGAASPTIPTRVPVVPSFSRTARPGGKACALRGVPLEPRDIAHHGRGGSALAAVGSLQASRAS
jgi:hypothetical protein